MIEESRQNGKVSVKKLLAFGFVEQRGSYRYCSDLAQGQLCLTVMVTAEGKLYTEAMDRHSGGEYVLHRVPGATGSFVGQVKEEYAALLEEIQEKCFDREVFQHWQARQIIAYVWDMYGDDPEFLWKKSPNNAVFRRKDTQKWYAALLTVARRKLGFDADGSEEILNLRLEPAAVEAIVDGVRYLPGYHMNKKRWITLCLNGTIPNEEIFQRIHHSRRLAVK